MNQLSPQILLLGAAVAVAFVLWSKGYLDDLLGMAGSSASRTKQSGAPVSPSDKLFEKAIVACLEEAKNRATQKLVDQLKAQVEAVVSAPFSVAGAPTPPAQAPPAAVTVPGAATTTTASPLAAI